MRSKNVLLHNIILRESEGKGSGPAAAPAGPEQRPTDPHTAAVGDALNTAATSDDDSGLNVADQPATTEKALRGADADTEPEDRSQFATELEIRELLTFDPFADEGDHPARRREKSPADAPPDGSQVAQPGTEGEQATGAQPAAQPPRADELQQLRADLAEAQRTIRELAQQRQAPQQPAQPQRTREQEEEQERQRLAGIYSWSIPDNFAEALTSENIGERKQALSAIINAASRETHLNVHREVREVLEQLVGQLPQIVQGQLRSHSTQQDLTQDLYGAHPDLNKPAIRRLVPDIAKQVAAEMGATSWNQALRDAVAKRLRDELGLPQPQAQAPVQPQPQAGNGQRPPAAFRTTVRQAPRGYANRQQEDIMRTLGLD